MPSPSQLPALQEDVSLPIERSSYSRSMADLAALRVILQGESVIDTSRLYFSDRTAVDQFLRLNGYDTDSPMDLERLWSIHQEAVAYLAEIHRYTLPREIEDPNEIHDLFLQASSGGSHKFHRYACVTLKVMHILNHLLGRELVFNMSLPEAQLLERLSAKIFGVIDKMRADGIAVQEFAAGKKKRTSLVTKLLAKRSTLASQIFDRLRCRIHVATKDDLIKTLIFFSRHLFPFNYVVPGQSQNNIVLAADLARVLELPVNDVVKHWQPQATEEADTEETQGPNVFSGKGYRNVNFVVDIPLRVDDVAPNEAPAIAFAQTEIQLVDAETEKENNLGENAHPAYKKRQLMMVRKRLEGQK